MKLPVQALILNLYRRLPDARASFAPGPASRWATLMKSAFLLTFLVWISAARAQDVGLQWVNGQIVPSGTLLQTYGTAADASGNTYIAGLFQDIVDFDPGPGVFNLTARKEEAFIAKYDPNGKFIWAKSVGGADNDGAQGITVDAAGNAYISGYFTATADMNPGSGVNNLVADAGGRDGYILKLDSNGNYLWAHRLGGPGSESSFNLALAPAGDVLVTGYIGAGTATFGAFQITSAGSSDGYVTKLTTSGTFQWVRRLGGAGDDDLSALDTDAAGNIYVGGVTAGNATGAANISESGGYVLKLDPNGNLVWTYSGGTSQYRDLKVDADGNVYAGGSEGAANMIKLDNTGAFQWGRHWGTKISYLTISPDNGLYVTGDLLWTESFGATTLIAKGVVDTFVAKFTSAGDISWVKQFGGSFAYANSLWISADHAGEVLVSGFFSREVDFDPNSCVFNLSSPTFSGYSSGYVVKLTEKPFPDGLAVTTTTLSPMTQTTCSLGIPNVIQGNAVGVTAPSGYSTTISYQWQKSTSTTGPWENIEGEVYKDLQPLASSETLYYRRIVMGKTYQCDFDSIATSDVASVTISSSTAPIANSNGPQWYVCGAGNNTVGLTGSATGGTGPFTYQWYQGSSNGGTLVGSAASLTTPAVSQSTTFTLKVTDASGCIDTDQVTIVPAVASAGPDQSFCQGSGGLQIGTSPVASSSVNYAWTGISGSPLTSLSCTNCAQPIANPTIATVYRLTVTVTKKDGTTCTTTDDITITPVIAPGNVTDFAGADRTICLNSNVQLGNITDATYAYTWTPGLYLNATNAARPTFAASSSGVPEGSINYTVTAVKGGCAFADEVEVTVVNAQISDSSENECGPRWITHEGLPNIPSTVYTWSIVSGDGVILSTANGGADAYLKSNVGTTTFRRTATVNGVSCSKDVEIEFCGTGGCELEIETVSSQGCPKVFPGEDLHLAPKSINTTDWNYRWSPTNLVDNATAREVKVLTSSPATITLTITNKYDPSITCSESIMVNPAGAAKPNILLADRYVCYNIPTAIGAAASGGFSYKWLNPTGLNNDSIANPLATLTSNQQYVVEITEQAFGCTMTDTVEVTVANVVADAGPNRTVCEGATVTLGTAAPAGSAWAYSWEPAGTAWANGTNSHMPQPQVARSATGNQTFILTVTDPASGCMARDTVTLRNTLIPGEYAGSAATICQGATIQLGRAPEANVTYAWTGPGLSCTNCANPIATPTQTTTYSVQISYQGCTAALVDQVTVTVNAVPAIPLNDATACSAAGVAIGFGANGNPSAPDGATVLWSPSTGLSSATVANPTATVSQKTAYSVLVTLPSGCSFTEEIEVTPNAGAGSDVKICAGESTQIGTAATAGATYSWTGAGIVGPANVPQPTVKPTGTTTYSVTVTTASCTSTDQVVVAVNTPAPFNIEGNTTICAGGSTTLSLAGPAAAGTSWQWSPAGGVSSPTATSTSLLPAQTTTYRLTQTDLATGCSNYKEVIVVVNANTISATSTPLAVCSGTASPMTLNVTSTGDYSYVWSPSIGLSNAFIATPTLTTGTARTYTVTITNAVSKCQLVRSVPVTIKPAAECLAPVALRGNIFHDANGLKDVTINTTSGDPIPAGLYASLIGSNGTLLSTVAVGTNGAFDFGLVNASTYNIVLHQTAAGSTSPSLPTGWINMGENLGAGPGNDGTINGILNGLQVLNADVINANFGIEMTTKADPYHHTIDQPTVGQIINLSGSQPELTGSDPEDQPASGPLSGKTVVITVLPVNTTLLYDGQEVVLGVELTAFDPLKLQVQFTEATIGDVSTSFEYAWIDAAGAQGMPAIYSLAWRDPLPVTLVSFQARIQEGKSVLTWSTADETNSDRFEIEHSINGKAWTLVGSVAARRESKSRIDYAFHHVGPANGENLYRLKMIDADETFAYSSIRSVRLDVHSTLTAYPNPATDKLLIRNYQQIKQVVLHNASGVKIYQSHKLMSEGIDVSRVPNGIYTITLTLFDGTTSTHTIAVTR